MFPWVITFLLLFVSIDCVCMLWQCVRGEAQGAVVEERDSHADWTSRVVLGGDARRHQHSTTTTTTMLRHAQLTHAPFHSSQTTKKVKVAQTLLPSVGFWS